MKHGYLFAGQGAQTVGMGQDLYESRPVARDLFDLANEIMGFDLKKLCFEGPEEELGTTRISQPAILTMSLAQFRSLPAMPPVSDLVAAGLSLGEYTALAATGAISDADAISLVKTRGEAMQKACDDNPGGMASIIGLSRPQVEEIVREAASEGVVGLCNINSLNQIAIGGSEKPLERAMALAREGGAKKVVRLKVAGAFHTELMAQARDTLRDKIESTKIGKPDFPVVSNVSANYTVDPMEIRANLVNQLTSPVLWSDSVLLMINDGVRSFTEFGPGNVLAGLMRRIDRSVDCQKPVLE